MKKTLVEQLRDGQALNDFFLVAECERKTTRDNRMFLSVVLADATGRINAVVWDGAERLAGVLTPGAIVRVDGAVASYKGDLQVKISDARAQRASDKIEPADFLAKTPFDVERLFRDLLACKNSVVNTALRALLDAVFNDPEFSGAFKQHPAARRMHHAYVGGLLEHTLSVTQACVRLAEHYAFLNRDLLVTGALLHDVGKLKELSAGMTTEYTAHGQLVGHLTIGSEWIGRIAAKLGTIPDELLWQVQHMLLSHHGQLEFGSPVVPVTLEALTLHAADMLDAQLFQARNAIEEDTDERTTFTKKVFGLDRSIYKRSNGGTAAGAPAPLGKMPDVRDLDLPAGPQQESLL
jgi:3'-5' exoribonuclease